MWQLLQQVFWSGVKPWKGAHQSFYRRYGLLLLFCRFINERNSMGKFATMVISAVQWSSLHSLITVKKGKIGAKGEVLKKFWNHVFLSYGKRPFWYKEGTAERVLLFFCWKRQVSRLQSISAKLCALLSIGIIKVYSHKIRWETMSSRTIVAFPLL